MRAYEWRHWLAAQLTLALVALLVALLVAGCGGAGAVGGGTTGAGSGAGSGSASVTKLPCNGSVGAGGGAPSVTLRSSDASHQASAPVGALVEIRMDGRHVWRLGVAAPNGALTAVGAQGALEQGECVWDFRVAQAGDAVVTFTGTALCQPQQMCPQYALLARFTVHGS
jgi:hypothetical protein